MASPVNSFTSTMTRITPQLGETLVNASNNGLLQKTGINRVTRLLSRPKTANPPGWSRMKSTESRYVPLDMHHGGMSPSSLYLTNMKNGASEKNGSKQTQYAPNGAAILNYLSRNSTKPCSKYNPPVKSRSLGRFNLKCSGVKRQSDREDDQAMDTDRKPPTSVEKRNKEFVQSTAKAAYNSFYQNIEEVSKELERIDPMVTENRLNAVENEKHQAATEESTSTEAENFEHTSENNTEQDFIKPGDSNVGTTCDGGIDSELQFGIDSPVAKTSDWSTSIQRSVDINLNNVDPKKPDPKKTLSMDINVVVSVKAPDAVKKSEIGFQENSENKGVALDRDLNHTSEKDKLNIGSGVLSQKDLTDEIGRVYNFFKNNGKLETVPPVSNPSSFDIYQNFEKIKNLYLNTLKCVKAFKELRHNITDIEKRKEAPEQPLVVDELEKGSKDEPKPNHLITAINSFKYPIDFRQVDYTNRDIGKERSKLLACNQGSQLLNMRMYSSEAKKSDCEKAKKLPCLQSSEISKGDKNAAASAKSVCDKLCMPCCKPARDPPLCFYPYHKPPCKKEKPPRPAFSECKMLFELRQVVPCECVRPRATSCKKSPDSDTCAKR